MPSMNGVNIVGPMTGEFPEILNENVQTFLSILHRKFNGRRLELLKNRQLRQQEIDNGVFPDFLKSTEFIRKDQVWRGAKPAPGLIDRRVEITGPVDRKMIINALNSGATQFMADFEDSNSPTWENCLHGQINLKDAIHRTIKLSIPKGKFYKLNDKVATLLVRPRGWHLDEKHFLVDGQPISASIFDFAVYFFHNAKKSIEIGQGPYFYLPKMESHLEARLWNDIFNVSQDYLGIPRGTIRATCLIETILAAFEMEEIIYELRDHSSGLNCGRWDYIFSAIKKFRNHPNCVLPDRGFVTMTVPFMDAYVKLLIKTCHKREVHAMGGMSAHIPIRNNAAANEKAMNKVKNDKLREVQAGHDGTWVAHPDLVKIAMKIFNDKMPQPNQLYLQLDNVKIEAKDLLNFKMEGVITLEGVKENISVSLQYMESWLMGNGCVPINNLMEDAATAEIARSQLWQWLKHQSTLSDGQRFSKSLFDKLLEEEMDLIKRQLGDKYGKRKFEEAKKILSNASKGDKFEEFLTTMCYDSITTVVRNSKL